MGEIRPIGYDVSSLLETCLMFATTLERPMARKRSDSEKGRRDDVAVKFDRTLTDKAKLVASRNGMTLAEYLSELSRVTIERDFAKVIRDMGARQSD